MIVIELELQVVSPVQDLHSLQIDIWRTRASFGTTSAKGRLVVLWLRVRGPSSLLPSRRVGCSLPSPRTCSSALPTARPSRTGRTTRCRHRAPTSGTAFS